jgi:nucleoporin GLE1
VISRLLPRPAEPAKTMDSVARVLTYETPARCGGVGRALPVAEAAAQQQQSQQAAGAGATPLTRPSPPPPVARQPSAKSSPSLLRRVSFGNPGAAPTPVSSARRRRQQPPPRDAGAGADSGSRATSSFRAPSSSGSSSEDDDDDYEVDYDYAEKLWAGRAWPPPQQQQQRRSPASAAAGRRRRKGAAAASGGGQAPSYSVPYSSEEEQSEEGGRDGEVSSVWRQQQRLPGGRAAAAAADGEVGEDEEQEARHQRYQLVTADAAAASHRLHPPHHHHHGVLLIPEEAPAINKQQQQLQPRLLRPSSAATTTIIKAVDPVRRALRERRLQVQQAAAALAASDAARLQASLAGEAARLDAGLRRLRGEAAERAADLAAAELGALDVREGLRAKALEELTREHAAASAAYTAALERSAAAAAAAAAAALERQKAAERAAAAEAAAAAQARAAKAEAEAAAEAQRRAAEAEEAERSSAAAKAAKAEADAARVAHQQQQQQQEQQQQQQQQQAAAAAAKPPTTTTTTKAGFPIRAGKLALERAAELAQLLQQAEQASSHLASSADPQLKRERRALERRVTVLVSQISGTQAQVSARASDLATVLLGAPEQGGARLLVCLALASRLLSQCEGQVATIPSFAFPLAFVACRVGCRVPNFLDLLLARLQRACPMLVPQWSAYTKSCAERGLTREDHQRAIGFKAVPWVGADAPPPGADGEPQQRLETSDEFIARQAGYVAFYAALLQCDVDPEAGVPGGGGGGNGSTVFGVRSGGVGGRAAAGSSARGPPPLPPAELSALRQRHGLPAAWSYVARVLNHVPASRSAAAALMAFLNTAGYGMNRAYGAQFVKMLHSLYDGFLPDLAAHGDPDARAVGTRLRTYLERTQYCEVPEGREIPVQDESSYTRAT